MFTSPPTYRLISPLATAAGAVVGAAAGALVGAAAGPPVGAGGLAACAAVGCAAAGGAAVATGAVVVGEPHAARSAAVPTANEPWPARSRNRLRLVRFVSMSNDHLRGASLSAIRMPESAVRRQGARFKFGLTNAAR